MVTCLTAFGTVKYGAGFGRCSCPRLSSFSAHGGVAMRWSIRFQLLLPMVAITTLPLVGLTIVCGWLTAEELRRQGRDNATRVSETLVRSGFPLTDNVLTQLRGLSGAEFIVTDNAGTVIRSTLPGEQLARVPPEMLQRPQTAAEQSPGRTVRLAEDGGEYWIRAVSKPSPAGGLNQQVLWILYRQNQTWGVVRGLLMGLAGTALVAVALAAGAAAILAQRFNARIQAVSEATTRIAEGRFQPIDLPARNDELGDLVAAINCMTERLAAYHEHMRRVEQLRLLDHLGASLAHQLRNAVTGALFAVEVHAENCSRKDTRDDDSLDVARRQLRLIDSYLHRFFESSRPPGEKRERVRLDHVLQHVAELIGSRCRHAGVRLEMSGSELVAETVGDADALTQAVLNLAVNAIDAAQRSGTGEPRVHLLLFASSETGSGGSADEWAVVRVEDTGSGPPPGVRENLFEPFVSDKGDGTGLGLWTARNIIAAHGGTIEWYRHEDLTRFEIRIPCSEQCQPEA